MVMTALDGVSHHEWAWALYQHYEQIDFDCQHFSMKASGFKGLTGVSARDEMFQKQSIDNSIINLENFFQEMFSVCSLKLLWKVLYHWVMIM